MNEEARQAAKTWLTSTGHEITFEKNNQIVIGTLTGEAKFKPFSDIPYDHQETGVVVATEASISSGMAQARLNELIRWKSRKNYRRTAVMVHRSISEIELLSLKDADQIIRWPSQIYPKINS